MLKSNVAPLLAAVSRDADRLHLRVEFLSHTFENVYPSVKELLSRGRHRNVLFNLDQCGHSHVDRQTLVDIMRSYPSAEVFYTFAIQALIAFLRKAEPALLAEQLAHIDISGDNLKGLSGVMSKNEWLGAAERLVFDTFRNCAPCVSRSGQSPKPVRSRHVRQ